MRTSLHTRYKTQDGQVVPGVTTVLGNLGWSKAALLGWQRKMLMADEDPDKVKEIAAGIGTIAHAMIHAHVIGSEFDTSQYAPADVIRASKAFGGFIAWQKENKLRVVLYAEEPLVSEKWGYGGTTDAIIASVNEQSTIMDYKTSSGVYPEMVIQLAAYRQLWREKHPEITIDRGIILKLSKDDGGFTPYSLSSEMLDYGWAAFQHCLALHNLGKKIRV